MAKAGEFDGREYALGSVKGVRSFRVDGHGRLTGHQFQSVWKPGVNIAQCRQNERSISVRLLAMTLGQPVADEEPAEEHTLASCQHGFYAYYDGSDDYHTDDTISAVIEGFGETVIGSRGFRSEKARILALCIPKQTPFLLRREIWVSTAVTFLTLILFNMISPLPLWANLLISIAYGALMGFLPFPKRWRSKTNRLPAAMVAKVRRNYPNVPVFTSFKAMVAAFPPDHGLALTPEDAEFWSMP